MTGEAVPTFPGFQGFPSAVGTLLSVHLKHKSWRRDWWRGEQLKPLFSRFVLMVCSHQANAKAKAMSLTYGYCCFPFNYSHQTMPKIKEKIAFAFSRSLGVNGP